MGLRRSLDLFSFYVDAVEGLLETGVDVLERQIKAVAGFGNVLARKLDTDYFIFGLPGRFLWRYLLWSAQPPSDTDEAAGAWPPASTDIPSWSWASQRTCVSYDLREGSKSQNIKNRQLLAVSLAGRTC